MSELDPVLYGQLLAHFRNAIRTIMRPADSPRNTAEAVLNHLDASGWDRQKIIDHLPYIRLFMEEVMDGKIGAFAAAAPVVSKQATVARPRKRKNAKQPDLFDDALLEEDQRDRAWIDQLIADSKLYDTAAKVKELLDFTIRMRKFAPFNAMLLHIQKPGLSYAARAEDWWNHYRRVPRDHARPLLVMKPFGPVDFVYDILDLEGGIPEIAQTFTARGNVPRRFLADSTGRLKAADIKLVPQDFGDRRAGYAKRISDYKDYKKLQKFEIGINRNHPPAVQAVTLFHELAHVHLGHCGADRKRGVASHRPTLLSVREVEAETVAYLVAKRSGLEPRSEAYLSGYKDGFEKLDLHLVMKTANTIERLLDLPFRDLLLFD